MGTSWSALSQVNALSQSWNLGLLTLGPKTLPYQHLYMPPPHSQPQRQQALYCSVPRSQISQRLSQLSFSTPLRQVKLPPQFLCESSDRVTDLVTPPISLWPWMLFLPDNPFFIWYQDTENFSNALLVCGGGVEGSMRTFISNKHLVLLWEAHLNLWL